MSDIRSALEEAFKNADEAESPTVEAVTPEPTEAAPEPAKGPERDESGKFKAKTVEAKETPTAPVEPAPAPEPVTSRKAPSSWKKEAQEAFLKADRGEALTPDEIKMLTTEAERRESDFHRGLNEFKSHSERAKAYDQAIAPYQGYLQQMGVDAPTAIQALMRADMTLRTSDPQTKAQYFAQLAKEYGIDLGQVQNPQPVDPQVQYLNQQMQTLRQQQQMWQNQIQQQEQMRVQQELHSFATADKKQHFDAVRGDMADLLETGKAKSLQEAYDMAVWMRPDIRQSLIEQQRQDAQRKAVEAAQAQRAKTAAVSVKGSSPTSAGGQTPQGSLRDILAAQFADN
jgi:hypothetical protein